MKKINKILILIILFIAAAIVIFAILRVSDYNETNSRCTFTQDDIKRIEVFDTHNNILSSYGYEISDGDVLEISKNLVTSNKIRISPSDLRIADDGIAVMILLYDERTIWLYSKDDNSIHAILNKIGGSNKMLSVNSHWLASYLKKVKLEFSP